MTTTANQCPKCGSSDVECNGLERGHVHRCNACGYDGRKGSGVDLAELRRPFGIGGSSLAAIVGISNWGSPWTEWCELTGVAPPKPSTPRQDTGHDLEDAISKKFQRETGLFIAGEQMELRHRRHTWARGRVDGLVFDGPREPMVWCGCADPECERPHLDDGVDWADAASIEDALGGFEAKTDGRLGWFEGIPPYYQAQAQWYMLISRLPRWWFGVLFSNFRFEVFELEADASEQRFLAYEASRFWHRYVLTGEPPPMDDSQATTDMLTALYPRHLEGDTVDLTEMADVFKGLRDGKADLKKQEAFVARLENEVRNAMCDSEIALVDGEVAATWRKSKAVDVETLLEDEPVLTAEYMKFDLSTFAKKNKKIAERYKTLEGSRRLLIKTLKEST